MIKYFFERKLKSSGNFLHFGSACFGHNVAVKIHCHCKGTVTQNCFEHLGRHSCFDCAGGKGVTENMRGYMLKLVAVRIYALDYAVQLRLYQITSKRETVFALENITCRGRDIFFGIKQANNVRGKRNIAQGGICFFGVSSK